ncbi:MAG TPA: DUF6599 family protein [Blastocatellia bacterium]|nr:DUF6599 family protein [Blastocatellia bacterium]
MHKLNFSSRVPALCQYYFLLTLIILSLAQVEVRAQSEAGKKELLPSNLGEKWTAVGPEQSLKSDQWSVLPDAEIYNEYGLQKLTSRIYSNGNLRITIEALEMGFASGAYGLFTFNRGALSANRQEFNAARFLISLSGEPSSALTDPSLGSLIEALKSGLPGVVDQLPTLPDHLPQESKIPQSEKYVIGPAALARLKSFQHLKELINFEGGSEIATADYQNGSARMSLMIIEYQTPQLAGDAQTRSSKYYESLNQEEKGKQIIKRIGNYLVFALNVSDPQAAEKIVGQIKYSPRIYWEGRKLSDVPVAYRQPDTSATEEATKTIKVLVRSFYLIGVLLLSSILFGLVFGGALFYYKRYRRRKLGIDDLFADTGETVRLNLDDYLLQSDEPSIKQLGDGKK